MKTLKKPLSMLLALVMVFGAVFAVSMTASAAGSELSVSAALADPSASSAKTGEDVTFTVAVDATSAPFDCMKFTFTYDATVWTFKSASWHADNTLATKVEDGTVTNGFQSINSNTTEGQVIFAVVNADVDTYRVSSAINLATVVLTAKAAAETTQVKVTPATADIGLCTDNTGTTPDVTAYTTGEYTEVAFYDLTVESSGPEYLLGDTNGDGRYRANDATFLYNYASKNGKPVGILTSENELAVGDINGDGRIRANDATFLYNYTAKNGKPTGNLS